MEYWRTGVVENWSTAELEKLSLEESWSTRLEILILVEDWVNIELVKWRTQV